jgi:hypothetical protein
MSPAKHPHTITPPPPCSRGSNCRTQSLHLNIYKWILSNKTMLHFFSGTLRMTNQSKVTEGKYIIRGECIKPVVVIKVVVSSPQTIAWYLFIVIPTVN